MSPELLIQILFYLFGALAIGSGMAVVSVRNTVYSALFLVFCFFNVAILWMLLEAEFLAIILVLVYVGAVMVLFLFVIMMLDIKKVTKSQFKSGYTKAALLIAAAMLVELMMLFGYRMKSQLPADELIRQGESYSNVTEIGMTLFTDYVYAFEVAAVILLVAIVAAIMLTIRKRPENKQIDASKQIHVNPADRFRVVSMDAEKGNGEES
ncbi:NADH:ubiquinone oxidoreductase subunit J [Marinicella pacifica]|uniref:NADH-quinone oxidoreductase subunit J n=1 Tax=Marinicella pacifica TaxID=1171543 RepID=A0A917CLK7_9GAMM|nr:NADH-quinone oxidoreductase subunit J [Marinicella pacifica]GGF91291.1 NADH:ubiquinone oxidoreductase subunit J [Marinicella pacifica]